MRLEQQYNYQVDNPIFYADGLWKKKCAITECPNFITNLYKSQVKQKTCSHSCQLKGNKLRVGKRPVNAFVIGQTLGSKNTNYKETITYGTLHDWVSYHRGRPKLCENCGTTDHPRFEWANISGEYKRDLNDWVRLCKMCHVLIDNSARKIIR